MHDLVLYSQFSTNKIIMIESKMEFGQEVFTLKNIHCWQQRIVVPFNNIGLLSKSKYSENGEWGTSTEYYGFRGTRLFLSS